MPNFRTGKVRLSYVTLLEPKQVNNSGDPKYSVSVLIPKTDQAAIGAFNKAVEEAKQEAIKNKWNGKVPSTLKMPLHDGDAKFEAGERGEEYRGHWYFNASCKETSKPDVVCIENGVLKPLYDPNMVYSGMWGVISIRIYGFDTNGSKGVACWLNNVLALGGGERFDNHESAEQAFGDLDVSQFEYHGAATETAANTQNGGLNTDDPLAGDPLAF